MTLYDFMLGREVRLDKDEHVSVETATIGVWMLRQMKVWPIICPLTLSALATARAPPAPAPEVLVDLVTGDGDGCPHAGSWGGRHGCPAVPPLTCYALPCRHLQEGRVPEGVVHVRPCQVLLRTAQLRVHRDRDFNGAATSPQTPDTPVPGVLCQVSCARCPVPGVPRARSQGPYVAS